MEKTPLGPRPADAARRTPLSRARAAVLQAVELATAQGQAATVAELATRTGSHPNTLRDHLDALVGEGLVRRAPAAPTGRGRPARRYELVDAGQVTEYAGLASALASAIHHHSPDPVGDAVAAGTDWGRELARARTVPDEPAKAGEQVVTLFAEMGFAPHVDPADAEPGTVHLTRCPLLTAARRYPDVVCGVHLGIARGALEEYGADASSTRLLPFAEPGGCVLHLPGPTS